MKERIFPLLLSYNTDDFSFEGSDFSIRKEKESTARIVLWREYQLINSYTLECSFCGPTKGPNKDCHFSISMLLDLGKRFGQTLLAYSDLEMAEDSTLQMKAYVKVIESLLKKPDD